MRTKQPKDPSSSTPYFFKRIKTYTAEEIIAAGGTTAFGKVSQYDRQSLQHLAGQPLSEDDYQRAIERLRNG